MVDPTGRNRVRTRKAHSPAPSPVPIVSRNRRSSRVLEPSSQRSPRYTESRCSWDHLAHDFCPHAHGFGIGGNADCLCQPVEVAAREEHSTRGGDVRTQYLGASRSSSDSRHGQIPVLGTNAAQDRHSPRLTGSNGHDQQVTSHDPTQPDVQCADDGVQLLIVSSSPGHWCLYGVPSQRRVL